MSVYVPYEHEVYLSDFEISYFMTDVRFGNQYFIIVILHLYIYINLRKPIVQWGGCFVELLFKYVH